MAKEGVTIKTICRLKPSGLGIPLWRSVKFPPAAERMRHGETLAEPAAEDHRGRNELDGALGWIQMMETGVFTPIRAVDEPAVRNRPSHDFY
jgi:hypothetical protein